MAAPTDNTNPFLQNKFMPQSGLPMGGSPQGMPNGGGSNDGFSFGKAASNGLTGLGNFLYGMGQSDLQQSGQNITGGASLMNGINSQQQIAQNGSQAAAQMVDPRNSTIPFEKMALAKALADAGPAQNINPGGVIGNYTPQTPTNDNQWKAIQSAADQYFSPSAIENSQSQYNKQLLNIDPYAQPINFAGTYGDNPQSQAAQQDMTTWQQQAQGRRADYNNSATEALKQALANNKGPGLGSKILGGIASIGGGILAGL